jgi:UDPglucose 6-dehydrogenase
MERARQALPPSPALAYADSIYAAASEADALLILTDWAEFAEIDLHRLNQTLRYPIVIDGRNLFEPAVMQQHGFTYLSIGRPSVAPLHKSVSATTTV